MPTGKSIRRSSGAGAARARATTKPRRRSASAPGDSEARSREVVEDLTEVICRFQADGTFTFVNSVYCRFFGRTREELLGHRWQPVAVPEDLPLIEEKLRSLSPANPVVVLENRVYAASGEVRWMQFVNRAFFDAAGRIIETQAVGRDITERKRTEEALHESEHRFMTLFRSSPIPTILTRVEDGVLQDANDAFLALLGLTREAVVGHTGTELGLWLNPEQRQEFVRRLLADGSMRSSEATFPKPSGEMGTVLISAALVDLGGRRHILATGLDHSERKRMETALQHLNETLECKVDERTAALRRSESQLETQNVALERARNTLLEAQAIAHLGSWEYTTATRTTVFSEEQYRIFGFDPAGPSPTLDEMVAKCLLPGDEAWVPEAFAKAVQNRTVYELEHRIVRPDGTVRWIYNRAQPNLDARGEVVRYLGTTLDITERKLAEEALRSEQQRLRSIIFGANVGTWEWNVQTGETLFNERWAEILGYTLAELSPVSIGTWLDLAHPDDLKVSGALLQRHLRGELNHYECEMRMRHKQGSWVWVSDRGRVTSWTAEGKPLWMQGTSNDISERRQTRIDLQRGEERHRAVTETMLHGVVHQRADGTIIAMNPAADRILGRSQAEFLGSSSVKEEHHTVHEDGSPFPGLEHPAMVTLRTGQPVRGVVMGIWNPRRKERRWIEIDAVPVFAPGQPLPAEVYTVFADITERKQAEEAFRVLTAQLDEIREEERQRLGRELHDGLSQVLTATKFKIGLLKRQVQRQVPLDAGEVGDLEDEINQALEQARSMARGLNPSTLLARGLVAALEDLARSTSTTFRLDCVCAAAAPVVVGDQQVALHLYRIAQEAVQNAVQHARPRHVVIRLAERAGMGCLEVLDDGLGFSPAEPPTGMGLANLHTRAQAIGGRLEIQPRPGGGTAVTCSWPIHAHAETPAPRAP